MTVESGHEPTEWASVPRPTAQPTPAAQSVHYNSARHGSHVEESPELLRWRADLLMDEMMMGGVDVSAADGNRTFSGVDAPVVQRPQSPPNGSANGGSFKSDHGRSPRDGYERNPYESGSRSNGGNGASTYPNGGYGNQSPTIGSQTNGNNSYDAPSNGSQSNGAYTPYNNDSNDRLNTDRPNNGAPSNGYPRPAESGRPAEGNEGGYPSPATSNEVGRRDFGSEPRAFDRRPSETRPGDTQPYESRPYETRPSDVRNGEAPERYAPRPEIQPDSGSSRAYDEPKRQVPTRPTPPTSPNSGPISEPDNISYNKSSYDSHYEPGRYDPGRYDAGNDKRAGAATYGYDASAHESESSGRVVRREDEPSLNQSPQHQSPQPTQSTLRTTMDGSPAINRGEQSPRTERVSAEPTYEPYRREPSVTMPPAESTPPVTATRPPLTPLTPPVESTRPTTPPRVTPQPVDQHTQWATGPDKWEYQDFSANEEEAEEAPFLVGSPTPERRVIQESAVRSDPSQFVGAMSMGSSKKRSTLLPRSSTLDVDTLHREISDLHGEIAALLPVGNETGERARHLLDKAYSILQSDPMRSAEVEYYMQQVRTIVQRLYQARQWSDLYRQRLHVYLWGWLGLSAVMILARFIFQAELEQSMMWLAGVYEDHFLVTHWATFIGTAFAGALGGAIGALYTMQTHARGEYSFFDRKYGLRGLILPFMGLIVGALGYLIFGLIFALVGVNPSQSLTAAIVPTMAAFAFGFSQESIYGTRS